MISSSLYVVYEDQIIDGNGNGWLGGQCSSLYLQGWGDFSISQGAFKYCQTPVLGLELGVDFTFTWDNNNNNNGKNNNDKNNPHLNFFKGTALRDTEQGVGIRDKGKT